MVRRRHFLATAAVALLGIAVAGCGGSSGTTGGVVATPPASGSAVPVGTTTPSTTGATGAAAGTGSTSIPSTGDGGDVAGLGSLDGGGSIYTPKADLGSSGTPASTGTSGTTTTGTTTTPATGATTPATPAAPAVSYGPAKVELDGQVYTVAVGTVFPKTTRQFRVLSIGRDTVSVVLTAGEFSNGSDGIALTRGQPVSLVNKSQGVTYVLRLVSVAAASDGGLGGGSVPATYPTTGSGTAPTATDPSLGTGGAAQPATGSTTTPAASDGTTYNWAGAGAAQRRR